MDVSPISVPQSLALVLNSAGDKSGVDFDYLLQTAMRESSLDPDAKAAGSSAVGLFQFLDSTWLQVMKEEGPRLGYDKYADAITRDADGDYTIKDKDLRTEVLKLREDPQVAADMAAAFTRSNGAYLQEKFGRMPSPGELYIAHFLGPQGAEKLFNAGLKDPDQIAATLFPRQARANRQIFYASGQPRTIREVYRALVAQHNGTGAVTAEPNFVTQQIASGSQSRWPDQALPSRFGPDDMSFATLFSTEADTGVLRPLIAMDPSQPLMAIEAASPAIDGESGAPLGYMPLPAPTPLTGEVSPPLADTPVDLVADATAETGVPRPRILLTPRRPATPDYQAILALYAQR